MTFASPAPRCPECGAAYRLGGSRCWLCGGRLPENEVLPRPAPALQSGEIVDAMLVTRETETTFSLSSLFLVMTLVAVAAGAFAAAPGLGILFLVIAMPALARTMVVSSRRKARGIATRPGAKVLDFLLSTFVVAAILLLILAGIAVAGVVAFFVACADALAGGAAPGNSDPLLWGAVAGGVFALAGVGMAVWVAWSDISGWR